MTDGDIRPDPPGLVDEGATKGSLERTPRPKKTPGADRRKELDVNSDAPEDINHVNRVRRHARSEAQLQVIVEIEEQVARNKMIAEGYAAVRREILPMGRRPPRQRKIHAMFFGIPYRNPAIIRRSNRAISVMGR